MPRDPNIERTQINDDEDQFETSLRPLGFRDFVGQESLRENLGVMVRSAQKRKAALDHILFSGPPGLGKTTLGLIIARELGVNLHMTSGPALERKGDLAGILRGRREPLSSDGRLLLRHHHRRGLERSEHETEPAPVHVGWCHDPRWACVGAATRPIRARGSSGLLRRRGVDLDR